MNECESSAVARLGARTIFAETCSQATASLVEADYVLSKNNADYEIGLCAAMACSIIQFNF